MLEILQGSAYVLSILFFWSGSIYFDLQNRKMKEQIAAQKKFQQVMQSKEFMKEYLQIMKSGKEDKDV